MSIIQSLREKSAWIITGAIAFALLVFVVEEGLRNKSIFGESDRILGTVNGTKIDRQDFEEKFKNVETRYTRMGYNMDEATRTQERNRLWEELVDNAILDEMFEKYGFEVTDKEIGDYLYGNNPPPDFKQRFTDPNTQLFNADQAYQTVQQIKKNKNSPDYASFFGEYIPALVRFRKREKFEAMISNSIYTPKWMIEKLNNESNQIASVSIVSVPYGTVSDSSVKVTDADVTEYINKHKSLFKQEKAAGIDYVIFSGAPSKDDTAAVLTALQNARDTFARTNDMEVYLQNESSQTPFYNSYISRKQIQIEKIDSIINTPAGSVYGPYLDGGTYVMARVIGTRVVPDTVKVRHILVATMQQDQSGQMIPVRAEDDAKKLADSLFTAIKGGSNFDTLCLKFSDDGSKDKGGIYDKVTTGSMVPEFNDFIFTNPVGAKGIVKTIFGYHIIEMLSTKGSSVGYKIAYLSKPILATDETVNNAMGLATQFAAESRTKKQFEENAAKRNLNIFNAAEVKPLEANIIGIPGNSRDIVRWMFNDAAIGDVAERPFTVGDQFVVPVLTHKYEEGTMTVDRARSSSEAKIRQLKKAAQLSAKIEKATTLEAVSQALNAPIVKADSLRFGNPNIPNMGFESKVVGAAFDKNNQGKISKPIAGELGLFVIQTDKVGAVSNANMDTRAQQLGITQQLRSMVQRTMYDYLRKSAKIKDSRYKYF